MWSTNLFRNFPAQRTAIQCEAALLLKFPVQILKFLEAKPVCRVPRLAATELHIPRLAVHYTSEMCLPVQTFFNNLALCRIVMLSARI